MPRCFPLLAALTVCGAAAAGDCTVWQQQNVPTPDAQGLLYGIDTAPDGSVWAVGRTSVQIGPFSYDDQPFATRWDGSTWQAAVVPHPSPFVAGLRDASFSDVAVLSADDAWAVGTYRTSGADGFPGFQTLAMHWNGVEWAHVPTPLTPAGGTGGFLYAIDALGPDDVWVGGSRVAPENPLISTTALLMHWNGTSWTEIPNAPIVQSVHRIEDIRAFADGTVWCAGHFGEVAGQNPWLARWDGGWTLYEGLPIPPGQNALNAIAGSAPNDVWAVGRSVSPLGTFAIVLHWDGAAWNWDAPDVSSLVTLSLLGVGVSPDGTVHLGGVWTNEPSPALPLPYLARRTPDGVWSGTEVVSGGPASASYRDLVVDDDCSAWVVGQEQPLLATAARLAPPAGVAADLDGDGIVGITDLVGLLSAWGPCAGCAADFDGDGLVALPDLLVLLSAWG